MFWSLVSLLLVLLAIRLVVWLVRSFVAWLGRGPLIHRAAEGRNVPEDVQVAARLLEEYQVEKAVGREVG